MPKTTRITQDYPLFGTALLVPINTAVIIIAVTVIIIIIIIINHIVMLTHSVYIYRTNRLGGVFDGTVYELTVNRRNL